MASIRQRHEDLLLDVLHPPLLYATYALCYTQICDIICSDQLSYPLLITSSAAVGSVHAVPLFSNPRILVTDHQLGPSPAHAES